MAQEPLINTGEAVELPGGMQGVVTDWSADKEAFGVPWGKAMMWIFLVSDTFIFASFLTGYMTVRMSTTVPWPNPSEVFALTIAGHHIPLILIAIMTFVLITSSGTMAMAVNFGYRGDPQEVVILMLLTALLGAMFVGMQAFEWTKLIVEEGVRPWGNPMGAAQFGSTFFMITGFHGLHVSIGVIYLSVVAFKVGRGDYEKKATTRLSRLPGCTGISSIWSGCLFSHSSICGRRQHGTRRRPAASNQDLSVDLVSVIRTQCLLVHGGLPAISGLFALVADPAFHVFEGGPDRRRLHAHEVGAIGADLRNSGAAVVPAGADRPDGLRR